MEVKDLNNVSSVQAMFSKAVAGAKTGQVLGDGFASLVSQVSDIVGGASKSEPVERSDSKIVVDNKAKPSAEKVDTKKEKNVKKSKPSSDDKEAAVSKKERKSSASDVSTDAPTVAEDNSNTKTVSEGADTPVVSENAVQSNASVEENTPVADDRGALVSDNSTITNIEPQRATEATAVQPEAPVQQTTPPVQQTEPATQIVPTETGNSSEGNHSPIIYFCKLEWNGLTFCVNDQINATGYTRDQYIGKVSEFEGVYSDAYGYLVSPADSVYTTTENAYVLIVIKTDGTMIAMTSPAYSDGVVYKQHTEDVPYEDVQNYNGGFQAFN